MAMKIPTGSTMVLLVLAFRGRRAGPGVPGPSSRAFAGLVVLPTRLGRRRFPRTRSGGPPDSIRPPGGRSPTRRPGAGSSPPRYRGPCGLPGPGGDGPQGHRRRPSLPGRRPRAADSRRHCSANGTPGRAVPGGSPRDPGGRPGWPPRPGSGNAPPGGREDDLHRGGQVRQEEALELPGEGLVGDSYVDLPVSQEGGGVDVAGAHPTPPPSMTEVLAWIMAPCHSKSRTPDSRRKRYPARDTVPTNGQLL